MKLSTFLIILIIKVSNCFYCQSIAITIDDVPNTKQFYKDNYESIFLNKLDSLNIPVTIFINEGLLYKTNSTVKNFALLNEWVKKEFVTLGNHTFSHPRYSKVGLDKFSDDITKGESITRELAKKYEKSLKYFRFPFNDLGKDSTQHLEIKNLLLSQNYIITPFTFESSDWMFNYLYEHYFEQNQKEKAKQIAEIYIKKTLEYLDYVDSITTKLYRRKVNHIYLCHDNKLNTDYIEVLVSTLKAKGFSFATLDKIMEDDIYSQPDVYYKKWGISWIYRWMPDHKKRIKLMKQEPDLSDIFNEYKRITESKNKSLY